MGYGIIELKCPNGHLWNIEWCSVGVFRSGPSNCPTCGEKGKGTDKRLQELLKSVTQQKN